MHEPTSFFRFLISLHIFPFRRLPLFRFRLLRMNPALVQTPNSMKHKVPNLYWAPFELGSLVHMFLHMLEKVLLLIFVHVFNAALQHP